MIIEKMTSDHIEAVSDIEKMCFVHPWQKEELNAHLDNPTSVFFVAADDKTTLGYIGMSVVLDEGYIFNVAVDEKHRQKGVGTALVKKITEYGIENNFSFITLEVRESNQKAISLYSKLGFVSVGVRKNYYSEPKENAILMTKYFKSCNTN